MSNKVRILYLESDNADAETVGALVGIVREVQSGGAVTPSVQHLAEPVRLAQPEPASLLAPKARKVRSPRKAKVDVKSLVAPKCGKCGQPGHNARSCKAG